MQSGFGQYKEIPDDDPSVNYDPLANALTNAVSPDDLIRHLMQSSSAQHTSAVKELNDSYEIPDCTPYVAELVSANGNIHLACERLGITIAKFLAIVAGDPNSEAILQRQLRVYSSILAFQMVGESMLVMKAKLAELEAKDAAKNFNSLLNSVEVLTRGHKDVTNINVYEAAMRNLPTSVREALEMLSAERDARAPMVIDYNEVDEGE